MNLARLVTRNVTHHRMRSISILLSIAAISFFILSVSAVIKVTDSSMGLVRDRLGADIVVVAEGGEYAVEVTSPESCGGLQAIVPVADSLVVVNDSTDIAMPESKLNEVASVWGVSRVSPQIFLQSLSNASCCSVSEMFLVAFDPDTDFTLHPWLEEELDGELGRGEVIGGSYVSSDAYDNIQLYGYEAKLVGNLEPSGTGIDQSLFMTFQTARDIAESSLTTAQSPLEIVPGSISTILVKVADGVDPHLVALEITSAVEGVVPIESPSLFGNFRRQVTGLLWGAIAVTLVFWGVSMFFISQIIAASINERHREVAVLRALGADRKFIYVSLVTEVAVLALSGGVLGAIIASFTASMFGDFITTYLGIPFLFPGLSSWLILVVSAVGLILLTVTLAALLPAYRMSQQEPALAARE